jgi:iron complex transport system substrate-binding protein
MRNLFLFIFVLSVIACAPKQSKTNKIQSAQNEVRYATGFSLRTFSNYQEVVIHQPTEDALFGKVYWLGETKDGLTIPDSVTFIKTPVQKIICTSTTHLPHLESLQQTNSLVGFPGTDYICSELIRHRVANGQVAELGPEADMNIEKILALQPNIVMGYTLSHQTGAYKSLNKLAIPVLYNADFLEQHPLGRAEWIKVTAALFNKTKQADSIFNEIEKNYLHLKNLAEQTSIIPSVFSGVLYGDGWFMPGGKNYASILFRDSGMRYVWAADSSSGYLQLPVETVLQQAKHADLWIGTASFSTLKDLEKADHRYTMFDAFTKGNVFHYNAKVSPGGGSFYLEEGYLRADFILADLIKIAHPELLPTHTFVYHAKLTPKRKRWGL